MKIDTPFLSANIDAAQFGRQVIAIFEKESPLTINQKWEILRKVRNDLLDRIDLIYCNAERWETLSEEKKDEIRTVKQKLRNITKDFSNPEDVIIPEF